MVAERPEDLLERHPGGKREEEGELTERFAGQSRRWTGALAVLVIVMLANSAYLVVVRRLPDPPRTELAAVTFVTNVVLHVALGLLMLVPAFWLRRLFFRSAGQNWGERLAGALSLASLAVAFASGLYLFRRETMARPR